MWMISATGVMALAYTNLQAMRIVGWRDVQLELAASTGVALLSALFAGSTRRLSSASLSRLGHAYLVVLCGLLALFHAAHELRVFGFVAPFGPYVLVIGFSPLVLFSRLRSMLVTATFAGIAALTAIAVAAITRHGDLSVLRDVTDEIVLAILFGIGIAILASFNIKRLRKQMEVETARQLGSYQLEAKLGEGGMGEVWRATHHLLARPTAIKLVRPRHLERSPASRHTALERFAREARVTASLGSIHTIELYDFGVTEDGTCFIAMELIDGIDLQQLIDRFGPQPAARVRHILMQACDSLAEAHDNGLVHRDVKPGNLMVSRLGRRVDVVKVLDFGIVALTEHDPADGDLTRNGEVVGTPLSMAPEALASGRYDPRGDLYALGCVAYWLLTGRPVFAFDAPAELMAAHLRDPPRPPSTTGIDVPEAFEAIVLRCLAKDPHQRFASADALAKQLDTCASVGLWTQDEARAWWSRHLPADGDHHTTGPVPLRRAEITALEPNSEHRAR